MPEITDLPQLLAALAPRLAAGEWVFASLTAPVPPAGLEPLATFREHEGLTVICSAAAARAHGLPVGPLFRQLTLEVSSSLVAVGLIATVSAALAAAGIPCNVVSAFHHDHLFVPSAQAERALAVLAALAAPRDGTPG